MLEGEAIQLDDVERWMHRKYISTVRHTANIKGTTGLAICGHRVNNMDDILFHTDARHHICIQN
jgi:hypothetical protein